MNFCPSRPRGAPRPKQQPERPHALARRPPPFPQTFGSIHPLSWIDLDGRWMECGAAPVDEDVVATGAVADAPPGGWVQEWNLAEVVEDVVEAWRTCGASEPPCVSRNAVVTVYIWYMRARMR